MDFIKKVIARYYSLLKQKDKQKHLVAGFLIGVFFTVAVGFSTGVFMGVLAGAIKEYLDSKGYGCVEFEDFEFTVYGSIIGSTLALLAKMMVV